MCADDNRHLGMVGGALHGNRVTVTNEGGVEILIDLLDTEDDVLRGASANCATRHAL